jgi:hypothetical protein
VSILSLHAWKCYTNPSNVPQSSKSPTLSPHPFLLLLLLLRYLVSERDCKDGGRVSAVGE